MELNETERMRHDLRSELSGIVGLASLISSSDDLGAAHRWSERILEAAQRLDAVIERLP